MFKCRGCLQIQFLTGIAFSNCNSFLLPKVVSSFWGLSFGCVAPGPPRSPWGPFISQAAIAFFALILLYSCKCACVSAPAQGVLLSLLVLLLHWVSGCCVGQVAIQQLCQVKLYINCLILCRYREASFVCVCVRVWCVIALLALSPMYGLPCALRWPQLSPFSFCTSCFFFFLYFYEVYWSFLVSLMFQDFFFCTFEQIWTFVKGLF